MISSFAQESFVSESSWNFPPLLVRVKRFPLFE
jgi:hypothetical protein